MQTSLTHESTHEIFARLLEAERHFAARYPGDPARRQPVHTLYGGAHLFKAETCRKMGELARRALTTYAPDAATFASIFGIAGEALAQTVYTRVLDKLGREAVEDFRIDFEDGYGNRPDAEEDGHAISAAAEIARGLAAGTLPPFIGIRIKALTAELRARSRSVRSTCFSPHCWPTAAACPTIRRHPSQGDHPASRGSARRSLRCAGSPHRIARRHAAAGIHGRDPPGAFR